MVFDDYRTLFDIWESASRIITDAYSYACDGHLDQSTFDRFQDDALLLVRYAQTALPNMNVCTEHLVNLAALDPAEPRRSRIARADKAVLVARLISYKVSQTLHSIRGADDSRDQKCSTDSIEKEPEPIIQPQSSCESMKNNGYLGLSVDSSSRKLTRQGFDGSIEFGGKKLVWNMLRILLKAGRSYTSLEVLGGAWTLDGKDRPGLDRLNPELTKLRKVLEPLSIGIENAAGVGWRLAEFASSKKGRSKTENTRNVKRK